MTSVKPKNIKATVSGTKGTQEAHIETKEVDIDVKITPVKKAAKETKPAVKAAPKAPVKAASKATKPAPKAAPKPAAKKPAVKTVAQVVKPVVASPTVIDTVPAQVIPEPHAHAEVKPVSAAALREALSPVPVPETVVRTPFHAVIPTIDVEIVPHTETVYNTMPGLTPSTEEIKAREQAIQKSVDTSPPFSMSDIAKVPKYLPPPKAPTHHNTVSIDQVKTNINSRPMVRSTDVPTEPPTYHREPVPTTPTGKLSMDTLKDRMRQSVVCVPVKRF